MDPVDRLYQVYDILADSKSNTSDHEAEYLEILKSVKGIASEKMLACQFIPRFFKDFPHLAEQAIDAQLDLLEDEDVNIRKLAIKHLPSFCKDSKFYVPKVADILAQMLQSDDTAELATVHSSLMTVLKLDVKATLEGLFSQILKLTSEMEIAKEDEIIIKRSVQFMCSKLRFLPPDLVNKDVEEFVLQECKKVAQASSGEEFLSLLSLLSNFKIAKTIPGQQALVSIVIDTEVTKDFDPQEPESIIGFVQSVRQGALPHFSPFISSARFVSYICEQILPKLDEFKELDKGAEFTIELIKLLAEISTFCIDLENIAECTEVVYHTLLEYIPLPPAIDAVEEEIDQPNLQFIHIECLMYTFSQLAKNNSEFLIGPKSEDRLKDLKRRLQFLARAIQLGIKKVRESLSSIKASDNKTDENKVKAIALRSMININSLIKDLFRSPPSFKTVVTLSWKIPSSQVKATSPTPAGTKRAIEAPAGGEDTKQMKRESKAGRELYAPPGGKYSTNVKGYPRSSGGGFYNRGRGRRFY